MPIEMLQDFLFKRSNTIVVTSLTDFQISSTRPPAFPKHNMFPHWVENISNKIRGRREKPKDQVCNKPFLFFEYLQQLLLASYLTIPTPLLDHTVSISLLLPFHSCSSQNPSPYFFVHLLVPLLAVFIQYVHYTKTIFWTFFLVQVSSIYQTPS